MAEQPPDGRRRTSNGTITGYVLRLARESIPAVQSSFAESLGVDLATFRPRSWAAGVDCRLQHPNQPKAGWLGPRCRRQSTPCCG